MIVHYRGTMFVRHGDAEPDTVKIVTRDLVYSADQDFLHDHCRLYQCRASGNESNHRLNITGGLFKFFARLLDAYEPGHFAAHVDDQSMQCVVVDLTGGP